MAIKCLLRIEREQAAGIKCAMKQEPAEEGEQPAEEDEQPAEEDEVMTNLINK